MNSRVRWDDFWKSGSTDRVGMALSALCLAHCLLLPLVLAMLPLFAVTAAPEWLQDTEWLHIALLAPVFLVSGPTLARAAKRNAYIGIAAAIALSSVVIALFMPEYWQEVALTVFGASLLFVSHIANLRLRRPAQTQKSLDA